jgi:hypothetical protein
MIKRFASSVKYGAMVFVAALATSAIAADPYPGTGIPGGLKAATDGPNVTACWNDSGSAPTELTAHIDYLDGVTGDIVASLEACDDPITDLLFDDDLTDPTLLGKTTCVQIGGDFAGSATTTDIECDEWQVQINPSKIASTCGSSSSYKRAQWCHEGGHGLGLGHPTETMTSCMNTGCVTTTTYSTQNLSPLSAL